MCNAKHHDSSCRCGFGGPDHLGGGGGYERLSGDIRLETERVLVIQMHYHTYTLMQSVLTVTNPYIF